MKKTLLFLFVIVTLFTLQMRAQDFVHPGILHKESDLARMRQKVAQSAEPWLTAWNNLRNSSEAQLSWSPRAVETVIRGGTGDNISLMYRDVAAAYAHALIYSISGNTAHADKAAQILNAWSSINKSVSGNADRYLAAGLNGYQFANAAELMRDYPAFKLEQFKNYMMNVFYYPMNERFLIGNAWGASHNDACKTNYRVNWDACNMNAMLAISILCDHKDGFDKVLNYAKNGVGNGNVNRAVNFIHSPIWGQWEESGRDQGHAMGGMMLYAIFCEILWNQDVDFYAYGDSRFRKGAEYVARYNIMQDGVGKYDDLPYTTYSRQMGSTCTWYTESALGASVRGKRGSHWEMIYNHYARRINNGDKVNSVYEILQLHPSLHIPSVAAHPDTYDHPAVATLTHSADSGSYILPWEFMDVLPRNITKQNHYGKTLKTDSLLTVIGSGAGIKETADQFQFAFQKIIDDGSIEAQINTIADETLLSQAGIMIRESGKQNAPFAFLSLSSFHGLQFSVRDSAQNNIKNVIVDPSKKTFPYWLRLARVAHTFVAYVSADRQNWIEIGSQTVNMARVVYAGVAVSSQDANSLCSVEFDKVNIHQANIRPVAKITAPVSSATPFVTPAYIRVSGLAYDIDGQLDKTEIYLDDNLLFTTKASPFTYTLSDVQEGDYRLYLKAYDNEGASTSTDTLNFRVNPISNQHPWYKFDETKKAYFALDASGNNMIATLYGQAEFGEGKINNGLILDGVDDYAKLKNGSIETLSEFTISTWIYAESSAAWSRIFDFGSGTNANMFLSGYGGSNKIRFSFTAPGVNSQAVEASVPLPLNSWNFIAVTLSRDNNLRIYLNGAQVASNSTFTNRPYHLGATTANYIGKSQYTADPYFKGKVDEFRIYNYPMTSQEVNAAMAYTSINVLAENKELFYPNPASDKIQVNVFGLQHVEVIDFAGRVLLQKNISQTNQTLDISHLPAGVYLVKGIDKEAMIHLNKLIVQ